jgi:hypothetical protein
MPAATRGDLDVVSGRELHCPLHVVDGFHDDDGGWCGVVESSVEDALRRGVVGAGWQDDPTVDRFVESTPVLWAGHRGRGRWA